MKAWVSRHPLNATALSAAVLFVLTATFLWLITPAPQDRVITVTAQRFFYNPNIIEVNRGDRVTVRLSSADVHHGLYLDGYDLETSARPGMDGSVSFVADKIGRYAFRCSMTCGPFHPYMVGYLRVKPDLRLLGSLWLFGSLLAVALVSLRANGRPAAPAAPDNGNSDSAENKT